MKNLSTIFLQAAVVLVGLGALTLMLVQPNFEGRNIDATLFETYFKDPFLAYVYLASIPFFIALSRVWKLLGYVRENTLSGIAATKAWKAIRNCALVTALAILGADLWVLVTHGEDDAAGFFMLSMVAILISLVAAAVASLFGKSAKALTT